MEINVLELINTCSEKVVGIKQVQRLAEQGKLKLVILADDADMFFIGKVQNLCAKCGLQIIKAPTRKLLGNWCKVAVPTAIVGIIN